MMNIKQNNVVLYTITFLLAACSILYELLLAQTVSFFSANTVVWYSLVLGIYLGSMGIGAVFFHRIFKGADNYAILINLEIILSAVGAISVMVIYFMHMFVSYIWISNNFTDLSWLFYGGVFILIVLIGILTGCELPLLIRLGNEIKENEKITNRILSVDYFGSLFGAIIFPLVLVVKFELVSIGLIVALINLLVAGFLQIGSTRQSFKLTITTIFLGVLTICLVGSKHLDQYFLRKYYYYAHTSETVFNLFKSMKGWPEIRRFSSPYQKIDLVYYPSENDMFEELWGIYSQKFVKDPQFPKGFVLFSDGFYQFLLDIEEIYHEYFAHVPVILQDRVPEKVLVLGAGDGLLLRELVEYSQIKNITLVEIDSKMIDIAKNSQVLTYVNRKPFDDKRVQVIIQDAYHYLRNSKEKFDAIYIDFPRAKDFNLSKLYTREFYSFVNNALKKDGYAVIDASEIVEFQNENYWEVYYSTLKSGGFDFIVPYFSTLEEGNVKAVEFLYPQFDENAQIRVSQENSDETKVVSGRDAIIEQIVKDFIRDHQHSFILVRKNKKSFNKTYKTFGISHAILNEERFGLTLEKPIYFSDHFTEENINSINRPILPRKNKLWNLRVPY